MAKCSSKAAILTPELPGMPAPPKRRGRPSSGMAKSGAARTKAWRKRQAAKGAEEAGRQVEVVHDVHGQLQDLYQHVLGAYLDGGGHFDPQFRPWLEDFGARLHQAAADLAVLLPPPKGEGA